MKNSKKIYTKISIVLIGVYVIFTLINQQKTLNQYNQNKNEISKEIAAQQETKEDLIQQKDNVNSLEFIEETAREKLDMYYPNERVYVDSGI